MVKLPTLFCHFKERAAANGADVSSCCCVFHRGLITLEDKTFVLEPSGGPSHSSSPSSSSSSYRIYRGEHLNLTLGSCGHGANISHPFSLNVLDASDPLHGHRTTRVRRTDGFTKHVHIKQKTSVLFSAPPSAELCWACSWSAQGGVKSAHPS